MQNSSGIHSRKPSFSQRKHVNKVTFDSSATEEK